MRMRRPMGGKLDAVLLVLHLPPAGADAELEAAAGDVVDGGGHVREEGGVAVGVADDEHAAAHAAGLGGHRGEQREALEAGAFGVGEDRDEVVEDGAPVVAHVLGGFP